MRYNCITLNGNSAFTVDISDTNTVDQLKSAIKRRMGPELNTIAADALKLYQINIDASEREKYIKEVQRLDKNLDSLTRLSEPAILRDVFPSSGPLDGRIHILVDGKLCMIGCGVVLCAVAETANAAPPPGFSVFDQTYHPLAKLCESFWGQEDKIKDLEDGKPIEFSCNQLVPTRHRLHFFPQYSYLQKRIDWIRSREKSSGELVYKRSVVVLGTPGIGKRCSTC